MIDLDAHVGRLLIALDFEGLGCSPALEAVVGPDADPELIARLLQADIWRAVVDRLGPSTTIVSPLGEGFAPTVKVHPRTGIIKNRAGRKAHIKRPKE